MESFITNELVASRPLPGALRIRSKKNSPTNITVGRIVDKKMRKYGDIKLSCNDMREEFIRDMISVRGLVDEWKVEGLLEKQITARIKASSYTNDRKSENQNSQISKEQ